MRRMRASPIIKSYNHIFRWQSVGQQARTFENAAFVIVGKGKKNPRGLAEFGEGELGPPDLLLAAESVGAEQSQPKRDEVSGSHWD